MIKLSTLLNENRYVVYRGDDKEFTSFDYSKIGKATGGDTNGFWFSDDPHAANFYGEHVRKFEIELHNPLEVSREDFIKHYPNGPTYWAREALFRGHDGVIIHDIQDGDTISTVYCVFDKDDIKFI